MNLLRIFLLTLKLDTAFPFPGGPFLFAILTNVQSGEDKTGFSDSRFRNMLNFAGY